MLSRKLVTILLMELIARLERVALMTEVTLKPVLMNLHDPDPAAEAEEVYTFLQQQVGIENYRIPKMGHVW